MKKNNFSFIYFLVVICLLTGQYRVVSGQELSKTPDSKTRNETYPGGEFYKVEHYDQPKTKRHPKNIILMIGDGMGLAHVYAAMTANGGHLFLENFRYVGFSKTYPADQYVTDSAAGGTALACGTKTYNGAIGVDSNEKEVENIREKAEKKGLKTGLVVTTLITDATPAVFVAHVASRKSQEDIAADFLKTNIDVFIGGGAKNFENRTDGRNLSQELKAKGYQVLHTIDEIKQVKSGKLAGLTAAGGNPVMPQRGDMLVSSTETAINVLSQGKKGFFLMVEGSEIDHLAHQNNIPGVVMETQDFDKAIGAALKFAANDKQTLVIVTADHETGGISITNGDYKIGKVNAKFGTGSHTGVVVPVYAFGPGAEKFTGFMENTDIPDKIMKLIGIKDN